VVVARGEDELLARRAEWEDLARNALEPNAFFEPWFLLPALRHFGQGVSVALVYAAPAAPGGPAALAGLFPVRQARLSRLVPVRVVEMWRHAYCFLCTPLLRADCAAEALGAFLAWLATGPPGAPLWRLELVSADGPFGQLLTRVCHERQRPSFLVESYLRARIDVGESAEDYLTRALAKKRLREVRRKERALEKLGRLERRVLAPGDPIDGWLEDFIALEAAGWKGRNGTAFASRGADAEFFREMARAAHAAGRLQALGLYLDGRPIALKFNLLAPPGAFAFKIAFDEGRHSQSPGSLLEVATVEHLHASRAVRWMDSCAVANHPMVDRLWTERRAVQTLLLATGRAPGDLVVSLLPLARWLKRLFRRRAPVSQHTEEPTG